MCSRKISQTKYFIILFIAGLCFSKAFSQHIKIDNTQSSTAGLHAVYVDSLGNVNCSNNQTQVQQVLSEATNAKINSLAFSTAEVQTVTTTSANFVVTYTGFTPQAQAAFQAAVDIWASLLKSNQTIRVEANFLNLGANVLGLAGPSGFAHSTSKVFYPVALADAISDADNIPGYPTITAMFSSTFNFYFGTDGKCPAGQYDFESVVLHELCHGLGFIGSARIGNSSPTFPCTTDSNSGCWGYLYGTDVTPFIFDLFVQDGLNNSTSAPFSNTSIYPNPSPKIKNFLIGSSAYFQGASMENVNGGLPAKLYAPSTFYPSSSYSHLDGAVYTKGNPNALMAPSFSSGQSIHFPGPLTCAIMQDIGWEVSGGCKTLVGPPICSKLNIKVFLEGAVDSVGDTLRTDLNKRGLLPGQKPIGVYTASTPSGNPYQDSPWLYSTTDTLTQYDPKVVDWVLVSLKIDSINKSSTALTKLGLLYNDGRIVFQDSCWLLVPHQKYFVVVEHRNHMGVMSGYGIVPSLGGDITIDLSQTNTYVKTNPVTNGEKYIRNRWTMLATDGDKQDANSDQDINFQDANIWKLQSGNFDQYLKGDFNLDGDVNFMDILLWKKNNGFYSGIPR